MASPVLTASATLLCPHGGVATLPGASSRVLVEGAAIVALADAAVVAGCASSQAPCVKIAWLQGNSRVLVGGVPVVTEYSGGLALTANQLPGGAPTVAAAARHVVAG